MEATEPESAATAAGALKLHLQDAARLGLHTTWVEFASWDQVLEESVPGGPGPCEPAMPSPDATIEAAVTIRASVVMKHDRFLCLRLKHAASIKRLVPAYREGCGTPGHVYHVLQGIVQPLAPIIPSLLYALNVLKPIKLLDTMILGDRHGVQVGRNGVYVAACAAGHRWRVQLGASVRPLSQATSSALDELYAGHAISPAEELAVDFPLALADGEASEGPPLTLHVAARTIESASQLYQLLPCTEQLVVHGTVEALAAPVQPIPATLNDEPVNACLLRSLDSLLEEPDPVEFEITYDELSDDEDESPVPHLEAGMELPARAIRRAEDHSASLGSYRQARRST